MKDALGHGSDSGPRRPIPDHPYHSRTDMELRYIQKDAHEAGRNAQEMGDQKGVNKYADQVNDASTVLGYRARGGHSDAPSDVLASGQKSAPAPVHDSMGSALRAFSDQSAVMRANNANGYFGRASNKGGRAIGTTGPHPDRETAAKATWAAHPNARQVSTSRGQYGMDIQWHRK